jgi:hypothetical protein
VMSGQPQPHTKEERQKLNRELISKSIAPAPKPNPHLSAVLIDVNFTPDALPSTLKNFPSVGLFPDKLLESLALIKRSVIQKAVGEVVVYEKKNREHEMPTCHHSLIVQTKRIPDPTSRWFYYSAYLEKKCFGKVFDSQQWTLSRCGQQDVKYNVFFFHDSDQYQTFVTRVDPDDPDKHESFYGTLDAVITNIKSKFQ